MKNSIDKYTTLPNSLTYSCAPSDPSTSHPVDSPRKRILIVEDDPDHREILKTRLEALGYACQEAPNGHEGLSKFRHSCFDLVIADYRMPQMSGIQFIHAVRKTYGISTIPIIFMTAHSDPTVIDHALSVGATTTLVKPYSLGNLQTALNMTLASK